jgi:uncharacterized small protein (DUF1192 family)
MVLKWLKEQFNNVKRTVDMNNVAGVELTLQEQRVRLENEAHKIHLEEITARKEREKIEKTPEQNTAKNPLQQLGDLAADVQLGAKEMLGLNEQERKIAALQQEVQTSKRNLENKQKAPVAPDTDTVAGKPNPSEQGVTEVENQQQTPSKSKQEATTVATEQTQNVGDTKKVLGIGNAGEDVRALQERLKAQGYNVGEVDGIYGENTAAAVAKYQEDKKIRSDGITGIETASLLLAGVQNGGNATEPSSPSVPNATPIANIKTVSI